jgi:murein tripeptide amidase MpaA
VLAPPPLLLLLQVVPIVNIDGRKQIEEKGDYSLRKNINGVDLNRNW